MPLLQAWAASRLYGIGEMKTHHKEETPTLQGTVPRNAGDEVEPTAPRESGVIITRLAELPRGTLLDEKALAKVLSVTRRTIRRMVGRYELPPPVRFSGRSMWQAGRVLDWFEARADRLAREAERSARRLRELP